MCVVSMVGDHYKDKWAPRYPQPSAAPWVQPWPYTSPETAPPVSRQEFDRLKREVQEMIALLKRAQAYDEKNNEPHCETDTKMDFLRKVAKSVGVDLDKEISVAGTNKTVKLKGPKK